jgi:FAD/FMN-containing dehydrogenase
MVKVSSWGRLCDREHEVTALTDRRHVAGVIRSSAPGLAHGMGRSYGDVCLNPGGQLWKTTGLDRFISFDPETGRLACEGGVLLRDIQKLFIPRGWILPVTPGTQMVTVGGAIANDVHGKNHHVVGSFGDHVRLLTLLRTDGEVIECGPKQQPDWFAATVGGLGLTGFILTAEIQLRPVPGPWVDTETIPYANLEEFFTLADGSEAGWEHTVSWIDCITRGGGRGLFMRGNHASAGGRAEPAAAQWRMPFVPPLSLVNRLTLGPFNSLYFNVKTLRDRRAVIHYRPFFYPLDNLLQWNRMYGPKGFYQYQSVVPRADGKAVTQAMLREVARSRSGSFLAVLKTFGERKPVGMLSFPQPGVTLALDIPNHDERTLKLFERLDAIVLEAGGRVYMAKDARMPRSLFEAGYPAAKNFLAYRDPGMSSAMSRRLMGS